MARAEGAARLQGMIETFLRGDNVSTRFASEIGALFADMFPDDERFVDVAEALAMYQPGGGGYLYNLEDMERMLRPALVEVKKEVERSGMPFPDHE